MSNLESNRRRFFRIVDSLGVSYRVLETEDAQHSDASEQDAHFVSTLSVMENYNATIKDCLAQAQQHDSPIANALEALNKKVDAILMMLELDSVVTQRACHKVEEASISASGIAFPIEETLKAGVLIALDLLLRPSSKHINAIGRVISCDPVADESFSYLRVEFTDMSDADKETLIQHIVQRQGALLRSLRDEIEE